MDAIRLGRDGAKLLLDQLGDELGRADQKRLEALLDRIGPNARIRLSEALSTLYPEQDREAALTSFRQLRSRVQAAAKEAGIAFALAADTRTRSEPEDRWCWFEGGDPTLGQLGVFAQGEIKASPVQDPVPQKAVLVEFEDGKPVVRYFISYAQKNRRLARDLAERLQLRLGNSSDFRFRPWQDGDILAGDRWHEEIQAAIEACHFGLLLLSHDFLASKYIAQHELPRFVPQVPDLASGRRRAVPVGLKPVPFDGSVDLKGLADVQVFRDGEGKSFSERTAETTKDRFTDELLQQVLRITRKLITPSGSQVAAASREPREPDEPELLAAELLCRLPTEEGWRFVPTRAALASLEKMEGAAGGTGSQVDALETLLEWAKTVDGPPFFALLGEYGMGKTTTCEAFTRRLLEQRKKDPNLPVPVYVDLRRLGDRARSEPPLAAILDTVLSYSPRSGQTQGLSTERIIALVREGKALAIFDGLDEVLVHLTPAQGNRFTRQLWSILPKGERHRRPERTNGEIAVRGKLLISCRTHFFRTLREERTHFTGEDREALSASDYRALVLLPFTESQVEEYLQKSLPGSAVPRILDLIRSIHNLPELAERPYTLSLIAKHIPQLEQWKLEGRKVTGVTLYRHMVQSWLERDMGKHQLTPDHKLRLMERFAAELWRSRKRSWNVEEVEQWLIDFLTEHPRLAAHYEGKDRDLLKEDLRTATFLVREGEDEFRFAHTSLLEFFLASHLARGLKERRLEAWDLPRPSLETLDFLGQILAEEESAASWLVWREIRSQYRPRISELALAYALRAIEKDHPAPVLAGFRLEGADLRGWQIAGKQSAPLLNLQSASFRGARLREARFERVDLSRCDFEAANLARAEILDSRARTARFPEASLAGTVFRRVDLDGSDFTGGRLHRTQWLRCHLDEVSGLVEGQPGALFAACEPEERFLPGSDLCSRPLLVGLTGHLGAVIACAFSPEGVRLASAGDDGTLRLWDADSGEVLAVLEGHQNAVRSCAFSPDGARLASGGNDGTLRLWDVASGEALAVLEGHQNAVMSCAFSPDGARLASAGDDGTLRLWDADSGEALAVLEGHPIAVMSCAFSPDGARLASAGDDGTLRLWDADSGEALAVLEGHLIAVWSCAFSSDGTRLASAGSDGTLRLWDAASGEALAVLKGHRGWVRSCVFSPDGVRLASAGSDGTLRLWDATSGEILAVLEGHPDAVRSCVFSSDGTRLASAGSDGTLRLWDADSGEALAVLEGRRNAVRSCAFSPDGTRLASAGDDGLWQWDADSGEALAVLEGHRNLVLFCAFSPDGARLASAGDDGTLRLWDVDSGEALAVLEGHRNAVRSCAFSPDGARLASAGNDGTVRLWDADSGEALAVLERHRNWVWSCAFSPDGARLASAGNDGTVRLWDADSGEALTVLEGHRNPVLSCAFSPDGARLASAGDDGTVRLWDADSGEALAVLQGHRHTVLSCAFSPDGTRLASADDGTVRLWDVGSGEALAVLRGHRNWVMSCAFSPDGARLASTGDDGTVRLWDTATGKPVAWRAEMLPESEHVVLRADDSSTIEVSPGAWRWLGWLAKDPATGALTRYPAEIFGLLPETQVTATRLYSRT